MRLIIFCQLIFNLYICKITYNCSDGFMLADYSNTQSWLDLYKVQYVKEVNS